MRGKMNMPVGLGGSQFLLGAARQDDGHTLVDVADCFVCLRREDGEVDRVLFGRVEFRWLASRCQPSRRACPILW
jgi:hypothetical protein